MSTYLVTGAAGFIGSHLCSELLDRGHAVRGVDAFTDYYPREIKQANLDAVLESSAIDFVEADLSRADLQSIMKGVDGVFHLAAQPGVRASWGEGFEYYLRDNLRATQRVFDVAANRGTRVVYASSSSVYGDAERYPTGEDVIPAPISPYGITKLGCEHLARAFARSKELDAIGLRYFTVFGPRQRPDMAFTRLVRCAVLAETFPLLGDGSQSRDFTFVLDAVAATIGAMERGRSGAVYNVGGGAETTLSDVIAYVRELAGTELRIERHERASGDVRRTASDTTRIRVDVGWEPRTSVVEGLRQQLEWMRGEVAGGRVLASA